MTYRDDLEAARARHDHLARQLADLDAQTRDLQGLEAKRREVRKELADAEAAMAGAAARRGLPMLDDLRVASSCSARWDEMTGDARVRFCTHCDKNVFNLSAMTRAEAEALVGEKDGQLCVRFYRRHDGTMLTTDCPVGVRRKRVRRIAAVAVGTGALAALASGLHARETCHTMGSMTPAHQGDVAVTGSVAARTPPPPETTTAPVTMGKPMMGAAAPAQKPSGPRSTR